MAQIVTSESTLCFSRTCATALALGKPPLMRVSMNSSAFRPLPDPQQKVCSLMVFSGISWKTLHTLLST